MANEKEAPEVETPSAPALTQEAVHGAITERLQRQEKKLIAEIDNRMAAILERLPQKQEDAPTAQASAADPKAEVEKMRREFQKRMDAMEQERAQEKRTALQSEEKNRLMETLTSAGLDAPRIKAATALLYNSEQRIGRAADGSIIFKGKDQFGDAELSLEEGVRSWLNTDDGKFFLPARNVGGSGTAATNKSGRPTTGKLTKEQRSSAAMDLVKTFILKQ